MPARRAAGTRDRRSTGALGTTEPGSAGAVTRSRRTAGCGSPRPRRPRRTRGSGRRSRCRRRRLRDSRSTTARPWAMSSLAGRRHCVLTTHRDRGCASRRPGVSSRARYGPLVRVEQAADLARSGDLGEPLPLDDATPRTRTDGSSTPGAQTAASASDGAGGSAAGRDRAAATDGSAPATSDAPGGMTGPAVGDPPAGSAGVGAGAWDRRLRPAGAASSSAAGVSRSADGGSVAGRRGWRPGSAALRNVAPNVHTGLTLGSGGTMLARVSRREAAPGGAPGRRSTPRPPNADAGRARGEGPVTSTPVEGRL